MYDIVIIGAGISGAYTAYRIAKRWHDCYKLGTKVSKSPPKILIVDGQKRLGGRYSSIPLKPTLPVPLFQAEFCAMRFYPTIQPAIASLVSELNSGGGTTLPVSVIPAANLPLLTPEYPAIDIALHATYSSPNIKQYAKIDLSTAITVATGDFANSDLLGISTGYTYLSEGINLYAYFSETPLSGLGESRFANGFQSLVKVLIEKTKNIYMSCYTLINANEEFEDEVSKSDKNFSSRFKVLLGVKAIWMEDGTDYNGASSSNGSGGCDRFYYIGLDDCPDSYISGAQVVYTGTLAQFESLELRAYDPCYNKNGSTPSIRKMNSQIVPSPDAMSHLCKRRTTALNLFKPHPGFKMYVYFTLPWWNPAIYGKFCDHPLLNQMIYYSPNVLLIYTLGSQSNTLFDMFIQNLLATGLSNDQISESIYCHQWVNASSFPLIVNYLKSQIATIIAQAVVPQPVPTLAQLNSVSQIAVHHIDQALSTPVAESASSLFQQYEFVRSGSSSGLPYDEVSMEQVRKEMPRVASESILQEDASLNQSSGIWYLSGDVTDIGGGWTEYCLTNVNRYIFAIESMLYK